MDQMMGGGDGGMGGQAGFPLETWFWEMPLCTFSSDESAEFGHKY